MAINPERIAAARRKLAEEPYDVDSWFLLLKHAQQRNITEARYCHARTFLRIIFGKFANHMSSYFIV